MMEAGAEAKCPAASNATQQGRFTPAMPWHCSSSPRSASRGFFVSALRLCLGNLADDVFRAEVFHTAMMFEGALTFATGTARYIQTQGLGAG